MKYNSKTKVKTKKCRCESDILAIEDVCEVCITDYELWCAEIVMEELSAAFPDPAPNNPVKPVKKT